MLKPEDNKFLTQIQGEGDLVTTLKFRCFKRWGHLLLLVPNEREAGLKTLAMYQPQRFLAKFYTSAVKLMYRMGLVGVLQSVEIGIHTRSPIVSLVEQDVGILLGNSESRARKIICISLSGDNRWLVTKIGVGPHAKESVIEEFQTLKGFADKLAHTPDLLDSGENDHYASYTVRYVEGRSPTDRDEQALLKCLESWQTEDRKALVEMGFWDAFICSVEDMKDRDWLEGIGDFTVCGAVVHGDFAPWNIKIDSRGMITVLDWEYSRDGGVAGWDYAHYLVQVTELVKNHDSEAVMREVEAWAESDVGAEYLTSIGWGGHPLEWIGSYLLFTHYVLKQDRAELIESWKLRKENVLGR